MTWPWPPPPPPPPTGRRRRWRIWVGATLLLVVAAGASGFILIATRPPELSSGGYLAAESGYAVYIQVTVDGSSLDGTIDDTYLDGPQIQSLHGSFAGTESGSSVTLTFEEGLGTNTCRWSRKVLRDGHEKCTGLGGQPTIAPPPLSFC